jgi:YggT family protein
MDLVAFAIWWLLEVFFYMLLGRLVIDLVLSANPAFRPRGLILVLFEVVLTVTDPPLKIMRRIIPTLKFGGFQLDLGWTVLVFAVFFLQSLIR